MVQKSELDPIPAQRLTRSLRVSPRAQDGPHSLSSQRGAVGSSSTPTGTRNPAGPSQDINHTVIFSCVQKISRSSWNSHFILQLRDHVQGAREARDAV